MSERITTISSHIELPAVRIRVEIDILEDMLTNMDGITPLAREMVDDIANTVKEHWAIGIQQVQAT